jgi:uncharacterized protein (DUF488 family)
LPELWTLGTSTRSIQEFMQVLKAYEVETVADVRHFPGSRRFPHFSQETLRESLVENGFHYAWLGETLGGYRKGGYEEHMGTEAFRQGIEVLCKVAAGSRTAIVCAEVLPWKCHRRYIARVMEERGWQVTHILDERRTWTSDSAPRPGKQIEAVL